MILWKSGQDAWGWATLWAEPYEPVHRVVHAL